MAKYGVVETTKITELCYDFVNTSVDIENGWVVGKGDIVTGERNVYTATVPTRGGKVYLVANPAWSYSSDPDKQDEDQFINVKGKVFRVYGLGETNKFGVTDYTITNGDTLAVGDYVGVDGTTMKLTNLGSSDPDLTQIGFVGKVTEIEDTGIYGCINVSTVTAPAGTPPTGGGVIVPEGKKIIIEVVQNKNV